MTILHGTAMVKSLLLLMLGLTLLREVAARTNPKAASCPPLEDHFVRVDVRLINQNKGFSSSRDIQNRSSSPWVYNITRDPNRFPSEIVEAQCRYLGCVDAQGKEDHTMNSVPIQQEFLILRRESKGCPGSFRLEKVQVTVGCTCVTPIIQDINA
ncbi:interleukin-17F [Diceros bicornis minor]|nr:interleukin-17F [Diceros bicornis minor]